MDLSQRILKSTIVLLLLNAVRLSNAASADDPVAMLRSSTDEVLSVAYSGHGNENLVARVRPLLDKTFAFDPAGDGSRVAAIFRN
jgi:hypothetical protein